MAFPAGIHAPDSAWCSGRHMFSPLIDHGGCKYVDSICNIRMDTIRIYNALKMNSAKHDSFTCFNVKVAHLADFKTISISNNISAVCVDGNLEKALKAMEHLLSIERAVPNDAVFLAQRCVTEKNLAAGRKLRLLIAKGVLASDVTLGDHLVKMFCSLGSLSEANEVFSELPKEKTSSWSTMISAYVETGENVKALQIYYEMRESCIKPNSDIFVDIITACCLLGVLREGMLIHNHTVENGFDSDLSVSNALIDMYCKWQNSENARRIFDKLPVKNLFSWNAMIGGYCHNNQIEEAFDIFKDMQSEGYIPNNATFLYLLQACTDLAYLEELHALMVETGQEFGLRLCNFLIDKYYRHDAIADACILFERMQSRDIVTWNTMINLCSHQSHLQETLCLFQLMQQQGVSPDVITFLGLLSACSLAGCLEMGRKIHTHVIIHGAEHDPCIASCIINMYNKCQNLHDACGVFTKLPRRNVIIWNSIITGFLEHDCAAEVCNCLNEMQAEGVSMDRVTYLCALRACSDLLALEEGRCFHSAIIEKGLDMKLTVRNTLIDMYGKFGMLDDARMMFDKTLERSFVTWNAVIGGYAQHGHAQEALQLFLQMKQENIEPDKVTYIYLLKACSSVLALEWGKKLHGMIDEVGLASDLSIANTLIDMYGKCGSLEDAQDFFDGLHKRDVVTWTALISSYADQNNFVKASQLFEDMQQSGIKPDGVSYLSVISACSHNGLVSEGLCHLKEMKEKHNILPTIEHYDCITGLLACKGMLEEAEDLLETVPFEANLVGWISLLGSCKLTTNIGTARRCFNNVITMDKGLAAGYVLMAKIYANAGMDEEARKVEHMRRGEDVWKKPGKAFIEVGETLHYFTAHDRSHPQTGCIHAKLESLNFETKRLAIEASYTENIFCRHSEKLAVVFGLLNIPKGKPIRVIKNLRICDDCHKGIKLISMIEGQEIIVRDIDCIHIFKDGFCSCNDRYYFL